MNRSISWAEFVAAWDHEEQREQTSVVGVRRGSGGRNRVCGSEWERWFWGWPLPDWLLVVLQEWGRCLAPPAFPASQVSHPQTNNARGLTVAQAGCAFPSNDLIACLEFPASLMITPQNRGNNWLCSHSERAPRQWGAEPILL